MAFQVFTRNLDTGEWCLVAEFKYATDAQGFIRGWIEKHRREAKLHSEGVEWTPDLGWYNPRRRRELEAQETGEPFSEERGRND